jgi:predicted ester cyclase
MDWKAKNQKNKAIVWNYWQRMNSARLQEIPKICKKVFHKNVNWNGSQPLNQIRGVDSVITQFWEPLLNSFPDIKRVPHILIGGLSENEEWVSGYGYFTGTFVHDWLGIPATGKKTNINFGQFFVMREGKIVESYVIFDMLSVMKQAGFQVLPPAYGQEGGKVLKPSSNGILLTEQDDLESRKTLQLIDAMASSMGWYNRSRDMENMETMQHHHFWHPDFHWMGPTGIGSSHTIEEYKDFHQRPWVIGFGDREINEKPGGRFMGFYGEGQFGALGIWDSKFSVHHGEYQGIPATKKMMTLRDFDWYRREGDLLVQNWIPIDLIDLFLQMDIDLFDRMHRQNELRKRGINWWDLPVRGFNTNLSQLSGRKF